MPATPVPRPRRLLLATLAVLVAVGCITLGPPGAVADARRAVTAVVEALAAPWPGTVQRAQVEAAANVLLFVPVGALAALLLRRRSPLLPLVCGAGTSVLVELAQTALPGRVPDLGDVVANTAGTAVGVVLAVVGTAVRRRAGRGRLAALLAVPLVVVGVAGCSSAGSVLAGPDAALVGPAVVPLAPAAPPTHSGELTAEDGWLPDGEVLSPFDDVPAITRLDPVLRPPSRTPRGRRRPTGCAST
jgi:VanZ family protein